MSDLTWAREQLDQAHIATGSPDDDLLVKQTTLQLLSVLDQQNHTEQTKIKTLTLFCSLARGHALLDDPDPDQWVPLEAGMFRKGDPVRVKADAFDGDAGRIHNGRTGVIVDARRGDVIVDLRDEGPEVTGYHYRPEHLEGLMR